jgi:hypothetical protein
MRVLFASHIIPYPPKSGVHLRSYHLLRGVASRHDVDLIAFIQEVWLKIFYHSREEALDDCRRELLGLCRSVTFLPIESLRRPGGQVRTALEALVLRRSYTMRRLQSPAATAGLQQSRARAICSGALRYDWTRALSWTLPQYARHSGTSQYRVAHAAAARRERAESAQALVFPAGRTPGPRL